MLNLSGDHYMTMELKKQQQHRWTTLYGHRIQINKYKMYNYFICLFYLSAFVYVFINLFEKNEYFILQGCIIFIKSAFILLQKFSILNK